MDGGIFDKLNDWIKGLGPKESRIAVFEHIRDIPYEIVPHLRDPAYGPSGLLKLHKGSCIPKHYLLGIFFTKLGIPVKYTSYPFYWKDCPIKFPLELSKIVKELPESYHLNCKAQIEKKWVLVDATYDLALEKAGFPVTRIWDGLSDTKNAVVVHKEIVHDSIEERANYEANQKMLYTEKEKTLSAEFAERLNQWLGELRQ